MCGQVLAASGTADFTGAFGSFSIVANPNRVDDDGNSITSHFYTFSSGAAGWAGVSNLNTGLYLLEFKEEDKNGGNTITFDYDTTDTNGANRPSVFISNSNIKGTQTPNLHLLQTR